MSPDQFFKRLERNLGRALTDDEKDEITQEVDCLRVAQKLSNDKDFDRRRIARELRKAWERLRN